MPWAGECHPFGVKQSQYHPLKDRILNEPIHPSAKRSKSGTLARAAAYSARHRQRAVQRGSIDDVVAVTLLGQEELTMVGEVQFARVARHQRVEVSDFTAPLRTQNAPQPLGFLLTRAERA